MSKANNAVYGTSYIPPNQQGDAYAVAQQVVFQGISTLSTFQLTNNDDWIQMYAVSPTKPPLFTTEVNIQSLPSIQSLLGRTQFMLTSSNTSINSDLNMNNKNILNVNEIDANEVVANDINLDGHHLTTDPSGNILVDGASADRRWYLNPLPSGSFIQFNSINPLSLVNKLYTPNGFDLWYNNINITSGGGGGGGAENWATYPANANVNIPYPYTFNVGTNAPTATFANINLCGNITIGRQSIIPLNAPNVAIYPYDFNVGDKTHPADEITMNAGTFGMTFQSATTIDSEALLDINLTAGGAITMEAIGDFNILGALFTIETADTNLTTGAFTAECGTIAQTATTSIINNAPLIEMNTALFNVLGTATTIESATTSITSGAITLTGATATTITSPLNTILGLQTTFGGGNVALYPTGNLYLGQLGVPTSIAGSQIDIASANPVNVLAPMTITGNKTLKVGNITDVAGSLNIKSANTSVDAVNLYNTASIQSVNGTQLTNVKSIGSAVIGGFPQTNTTSITFASPTTSQLINLSSITNNNITASATANATFQGNITQAIGTAELDLTSGALIKGTAPTITLNTTNTNINATGAVSITGATASINAPTTTITATTALNITAPAVNITGLTNATLPSFSQIYPCSFSNSSFSPYLPEIIPTGFYPFVLPLGVFLITWIYTLDTSVWVSPTPGSPVQQINWLTPDNFAISCYFGGGGGTAFTGTDGQAQIIGNLNANLTGVYGSSATRDNKISLVIQNTQIVNNTTGYNLMFRAYLQNTGANPTADGGTFQFQYIKIG